MTTAHRPTFDPVSRFPSIFTTVASNFFEGPWQRCPARPLLPPAVDACVHTPQIPVSYFFLLPVFIRQIYPTYANLLFPVCSQPGQGGEADESARDLRAELLAAEAAHFAKKNGGVVAPSAPESSAAGNLKRPLKGGSDGDADEEEDVDSKRRRILEETRDIDADSDDDDDDGDASKDGEEKDDEDDEDDDDDDDSEDEMAELQREVERIRRERQEKKEKEVSTGRVVWSPTRRVLTCWFCRNENENWRNRRQKSVTLPWAILFSTSPPTSTSSAGGMTMWSSRTRHAERMTRTRRRSS